MTTVMATWMMMKWLVFSVKSAVHRQRSSPRQIYSESGAQAMRASARALVSESFVSEPQFDLAGNLEGTQKAS